MLFAGTSFLQAPLSSDYEVLREFLPALNPDYLPEGGSNCARVIPETPEAWRNADEAKRWAEVQAVLEVVNESLEAARDWADADPYIAAGVYTRVEVRPFRRVLP